MPRSLLIIAWLTLAAACSGAGEPAVETPATQPQPSTTASGGVAGSTQPTTSAGTGTTGATTPETATTETRPDVAPLTGLAYETFLTDVAFPIHLEAIPGSEALLIASKDGRLWIHDGGDLEPFLDVSDRVRDRGEQGLLGVAFAPDFEDSGRFFIHYTAENFDTIVSEFVAEGRSADSGGEQVLFRTEQPARNHNGGMLAVGPDGYLYLGLGDGGGRNDQFGHGQDGTTPLGAILRFDVSTPGQALPAGQGSFESPAVWAIGLRNPWRFAIDIPSGLMIIGDVGQNAFEEISAAPIAVPGLNYGWPITEGLHCFRPTTGCDTTGLTLPVIEVAHGDSGTCSITAGVVYRGEAIPELAGQFLYSDFCGGYLRSFPVGEPFEAATDWSDQVGALEDVTSFGTDAAGEVYVLTAGGTIHKIVAERG